MFVCVYVPCSGNHHVYIYLYVINSVAHVTFNNTLQNTCYCCSKRIPNFTLMSSVRIVMPMSQLPLRVDMVSAGKNGQINTGYTIDLQEISKL